MIKLKLMNESRRVVNTPKQLEELIMDITSSDLNRQMQQLIADYKRTGNDHFRVDAEYLRAEFESWWNDDEALFEPPIEL